MSDLPYPTLIHKIPVYIRFSNRGETKYDSDTGEPVGKVAREQPQRLVAQVSKKQYKLLMEKEGKVFKEEGYLVFRRLDLINAGVDIIEGDELTQIGEGDFKRDNLNLYFHNVVDCGHNDNFSGSTLIKAWLTDKRPVRNS